MPARVVQGAHVAGSMTNMPGRQSMTGRQCTPNIVDQFLHSMEPKKMVNSSSFLADDLVPKQISTGLQSRAYRLHTSVLWHAFMNLTIAINSIQIGLDAEISGNTFEDAWQVCDYIFTFVFVVEMVVALVALQWAYFSNPWHYLDFTVANIAIIDTCILPVFDMEEVGGLSTFRVFRLLKMLRLAKMLKVVPELMMVIQGLFASIRAMFWVFVLLVFFLYAAGIFCKEVVGTSDAGYPGFSKQVMDEKVVLSFNNFLYFGSIARSMKTLFNMVILAEWPEVLRPVAERQPAMVLFFMVVVFLCSFGVLNVMIGVVVEHTTKGMQQQREEQELQLQKSQVRLAAKLADMVFDIDEDKDDRISPEELENGDNAEALQEIIGSLGLPHGYSIDELFVMLDDDGNGYLSKVEFVQGIMRLLYCDTFQRDCLFRTAIGQVKKAVKRSEERMRQSFEQHLQETCNRLISAVQQMHQGESYAAFNIDEFTGGHIESAPASGHADFGLPQNSLERKADSSKVVCVRVIDAEQLNLSGSWNNLVSSQTYCLEAAEVSIPDGRTGTSASLVEGDTKETHDVEYTNRGTRVIMGECSGLDDRKQVKRDALQKSLLLVRKTEDGFEIDARAAEEIVGTLSRTHEVMGLMPVVNRGQVKDSL